MFSIFMLGFSFNSFCYLGFLIASLCFIKRKQLFVPLFISLALYFFIPSFGIQINSSYTLLINSTLLFFRPSQNYKTPSLSFWKLLLFLLCLHLLFQISIIAPIGAIFLTNFFKINFQKAINLGLLSLLPHLIFGIYYLLDPFSLAMVIKISFFSFGVFFFIAISSYERKISSFVRVASFNKPNFIFLAVCYSIYLDI